MSSYYTLNPINSNLRTQSDLDHMQSDRLFNLGSEIMNHAGVRVFEHYGHADHLLGPIPVGRNVRLIPIGTAYILEQVTTVESPAQHQNTAAMPEQSNLVELPAVELPAVELPVQHLHTAEMASPAVKQEEWNDPTWQAETWEGVLQGSRKRSYDEYSEGEIPVTQRPPEASDTYYACHCCTGHWIHVAGGDDEDANGFSNPQVISSDDDSGDE